MGGERWLCYCAGNLTAHASDLQLVEDKGREQPQAFEPPKTRQEGLRKAGRERIAEKPRRSTHLFPVGLVHQENLAPYLNAGRLPLRPSPPGETSQRLIVISNPVHCFLQIGIEVDGVLISLWFRAFRQCWRGSPPIGEVSYRAVDVNVSAPESSPLEHKAVEVSALFYFVKPMLTRGLSTAEHQASVLSSSCLDRTWQQ